MISQKNIEFARNLAENAIFSNRRLTPKAGTPMSALVSSIVGIGEVGSWEEISKLSDMANTVNGTHTAIEADVAKGAGHFLSNIIKTARGEVNPRIRETLEAIEAHRLLLAEGKTSSMPTIRQVELEGVFTDELFVEMVEAYKDSNVNIDYRVLNSAMQTIESTLIDDDYLEIIKTGSGGLDKKVLEMLGDNPVNIIRTWYTEEPMERRSLRDLVGTFMFMTGVCNGRVDKILALIEDSVINAELIAYKAQVGKRISQLIERLTRYVNDGIMVLPPGVESYDPQFEIVVIGKTYRNWIEKEGGSPEAMMGYALWVRTGGGANESTIQGLKSNPTEYVNRYNTELRHIETVRRTTEIGDIPTVINTYLSGVILKMDIEGNAKIELQGRLKQALEIPYYGDTNLQEYVRDVVCKTFVPGDDVKRVLTNIDLTLAESPDCTMDYAVYVACAKLVGSWIAGQIEVTTGV